MQFRSYLQQSEERLPETATWQTAKYQMEQVQTKQIVCQVSCSGFTKSYFTILYPPLFFTEENNNIIDRPSNTDPQAGCQHRDRWYIGQGQLGG